MNEYVTKVYDPRKKEDFTIEIEKGSTFSSLQNDFIAIDINKKKKLFSTKTAIWQFRDYINLIKEMLLNHKGIGFFSFNPLTKRVKNSKIINLDNVDNLCDSILGYFDIDNLNIGRTIEQHSKLLSYEEWIVGNCRTKFERPKNKIKWHNKVITWDLHYLLLQAEKINCLIYYNSEMNMSILITRIFEGIDKLLSSIKLHSD